MKNVYSLVLSDEVIERIDRLAFKSGVSRSQFINDVLAEKAGIDTEKKRLQDIFDEINAHIDGIHSLRVQRRQQSGVDFLSALNFKYSPRVTYSVELNGGEKLSGELKISLRTTNPLLLRITENFFNDFIAVERSFRPEVVYDVRDGKLIRGLDFSQLGEKSVSRAITDYVNSLDALFNLYVDADGELAAAKLKYNYTKLKNKMTI